MSEFIPYSAEEHSIHLPQGIDFRRPGQPSPWREKMTQGQGNLSDLFGTFGGLPYQNPHVNGQAAQQISSRSAQLLGRGW